MSQSNMMRLVIGDDSSVTDAIAANGILLNVMGCDLGATEVFGTDTGSRGTRQRYDCGARKLGESVAGGFTIQPTKTQLDWLIKRFIGDNTSSFPAGAATPQETLTNLVAYVDKVSDIYKFTRLRFQSMRFTATEGDYLKVRCDFVGSREYGGQTWPAGVPIPTSFDCATEYVASDIAIAVAATNYPFKSLNWGISNNVAPQQENSLYPLVFEVGELEVSAGGTFNVRSDTIALYKRGVTGDAVSIVLADGTTTYTFSFANAKIPANNNIAIPEEGTITMDLAMQIFRTSGSHSISITKA